MVRLFTGDYSRNDFKQWSALDNKLATGGSIAPGSYGGYGQYPVAVICEDKDCGYVARMEVRAGDIVGGGNERSEVSSYTFTSLTPIGSTFWYAFSVKFDPTYPLNSADYGWSVTNQWHDGVGSPTVAWGFNANAGRKTPTGYWSLYHTPQDGPGIYLPDKLLLNVPMQRGNWIDVKMQITWATNDSDGMVRAWVNGVRQTLLTGGQTFIGRTATPGADHMYYKEGLYRQKDVGYPTGIIYHGGYRQADTENSL